MSDRPVVLRTERPDRSGPGRTRQPPPLTNRPSRVRPRRDVRRRRPYPPATGERRGCRMSDKRVRWAAAVLALVCGLAVAACTKDQTGNPPPEAGGNGQFGDGGQSTTPPPPAPPPATTAPPTFPSSAEAYAKDGIAAWVGN